MLDRMDGRMNEFYVLCINTYSCGKGLYSLRSLNIIS